MGARFSLNACKASMRSFEGSRCSYDARSKSRPGRSHQMAIPIDKGASFT